MRKGDFFVLIDGIELRLYSAMRRDLGELVSFYAVRRKVETTPELLFDSQEPGKRPYVAGGGFRYDFDLQVQPQDIRRAFNNYMNYPTTDR